MADSIKKAARWLGLVEDPRYDFDQNEEELTEAVLHGDSSEVTPISERRSEPATNAEPFTNPVPHTADLTRIITVHPRTYNEARTIGEHFRDNVPVIMNLSEMEDSDAKRLVDFSAGLIFGLRGTIERITRKVFLLSPNNVNVTAEDKERIAAGGFFNQS